jgi:hypothetical protein
MKSTVTWDLSDVVSSDGSFPKFQRCVLPPSSGSTSKPGKQ